MHKCKVLSVLVNLLSVAHVIIVTGRSDGRTDGHIDFYSAPPPSNLCLLGYTNTIDSQCSLLL